MRLACTIKRITQIKQVKIFGNVRRLEAWISTSFSAPPDHRLIHLCAPGVPHPSLAHPPLWWAVLCLPSQGNQELRSHWPGQRWQTEWTARARSIWPEVQEINLIYAEHSKKSLCLPVAAFGAPAWNQCDPPWSTARADCCVHSWERSPRWRNIIFGSCRWSQACRSETESGS